MKRRWLTPIACVMTTALLGACGGGGGGGGSSTPPAPIGSAEGAYIGTTSEGKTLWSLVMDTDQIYTVYGTTTAGIFAIEGFITGQGKSLNGSYSLAESYDFNYTDLLKGTASVSYQPGSSFNGSFTEGGRTLTFTSKPFPANSYVYASTASLSGITGSWGLYDLTGTYTSITIASDGKLSGTAGGSCSIQGTVKPHGSRNLFEVTLSFGNSCRKPGLQASGIAVGFQVGNGQTQLMVTGTDSTKANGVLLIGVR